MKKYLICILSAALSGLAFIFPSLAWLLFFAPALYCYFLFTGKRYFAFGFLFGFFFTAVSSSFLLSLDLTWLFSPLLSVLLPPLAHLSLSLFSGAVLGIFTLIFSAVKKRIAQRYFPLAFSSLWVIYEFLSGADFLATGYTWGRLSVPFARFPAFIQTASLFGMLFISFLSVFFSSSFALSVIKKSAEPLLIPSVLLLLNLSVSLYLYSAPVSGEKITAAAIQTGFDTKSKRRAFLYTLSDEEAKEFHSADLIVFPEAAMPAYLNESPYLEILSRKAKENGVSVLMGALYRNEGKNETSIYLLPEGDVSSKRHPVPFGEYTPILWRFSPYIEATNITGSEKLLPLNAGPAECGAIVCFDSIFPAYSRESVKNGANLLCISTNDSWFLSESSARLHLYHSIYRCIENSRFGVRSACTGISAIIDSKGNILSSLSQGKTGRVSYDVTLNESRTLYSTAGDIPILLFSAAAIIYTLIRRNDDD